LYLKDYFTSFLPRVYQAQDFLDLKNYIRFLLGLSVDMGTYQNLDIRDLLL